MKITYVSPMFPFWGWGIGDLGVPESLPRPHSLARLSSSLSSLPPSVAKCINIVEAQAHSEKITWKDVSAHCIKLS